MVMCWELRWELLSLRWELRWLRWESRFLRWELLAFRWELLSLRWDDSSETSTNGRRTFGFTSVSASFVCCRKPTKTFPESLRGSSRDQSERRAVVKLAGVCALSRGTQNWRQRQVLERSGRRFRDICFLHGVVAMQWWLPAAPCAMLDTQLVTN